MPIQRAVWQPMRSTEIVPDELNDSNLGTSQDHDLTQVDKEAETEGARRLLARSRLPPIRGNTP